jgi:predicted small lipoprotein YifL
MSRVAILFLCTALITATASTLNACGNKGPLYLPDKTQQQPDDEQAKKQQKKQN